MTVIHYTCVDEILTKVQLSVLVWHCIHCLMLTAVKCKMLCLIRLSVLTAGTADPAGDAVEPTDVIPGSLAELGSDCRHREQCQSDLPLSKTVQTAIRQLHHAAGRRKTDV